MKTDPSERSATPPIAWDFRRYRVACAEPSASPDRIEAAVSRNPQLQNSYALSVGIEDALENGNPQVARRLTKNATTWLRGPSDAHDLLEEACEKAVVFAELGLLEDWLHDASEDQRRQLLRAILETASRVAEPAFFDWFDGQLRRYSITLNDMEDEPEQFFIHAAKADRPAVLAKMGELAVVPESVRAKALDRAVKKQAWGSVCHLSGTLELETHSLRIEEATEAVLKNTKPDQQVSDARGKALLLWPALIDYLVQSPGIMGMLILASSLRRLERNAPDTRQIAKHVAEHLTIDGCFKLLEEMMRIEPSQRGQPAALTGLLDSLAARMPSRAFKARVGELARRVPVRPNL